MSEPMTTKPADFDQRVAGYREHIRKEYEDSGTTLTFAAWHEQRQRQARDAEFAAERKARRLRVLESQIPARYRDAAVTDGAVTDWADRAVAEHRTSKEFRPATNPVEGWGTPQPERTTVRGPSLLLLGPTGVGKTHEAIGALRRLADNGCHTTLKLVTAADMYAQLRPRSGVDAEQKFEEFADTSVLMLDDLGAAKTSEWVEEINYRLINHRYNHELTTVITSNVPPAQLGEQLGERVASRLIEMCTQVALKGKDRRRSQ